MLCSCWFGMLELVEYFVDIVRHGEMDPTFAVVPVKCDADVAGAIPICCDLVVLL